LKLDRVEISYSQKNKWDDDWAQYWFYAKIDFPRANDSQESVFPLASKVLPFQHVNQADFDKSLPEFKGCSATFKAAVESIGGRDLVEEYMDAKIWPLAFGWRARSFAKVKFGKMKRSIPCPQFGLERPTNMTDEMIVAELERKATSLIGPYNKKEHKSFMDCCTHGCRINQSLHEMGVMYESREAPPEPVKRVRGVSNVGPEEHASKNGKKEAESLVGSTSGQIALGKPPQKPTAKLAIG
jgi:hypothetical protein